MARRNRHLERLKAGYLFPEINKRKNLFLAARPDAALISLGIGDTTEPIPPSIAGKLSETALALATREGYMGYGPEQGYRQLRELIAEKLYHGKVASGDIFISDGAKCDIGRIQALFGSDISIAVQDPSYPVYVDGSLIHGVEKIHFMPCTPANNFFPDLSIVPRTDLIYFCSPNNPTGVAATRRQLEELVAFAKSNRSVIIYDAAYAYYIQDPALPKSIFEINGAEEVSIELNSFSKIAGFTGVRLGWSVVSDALLYDDGLSVKSDWNRIMSTLFNGASNIAQMGGCAALKEEGLQEIKALAEYYQRNTSILREALISNDLEVYGGENAPYLWVHFPGRNSWEVFQELLENHQLIVTPGAGFGPAGEQFIRLTAFGHRENIIEAAKRVSKKSGTK